MFICHGCFCIHPPHLFICHFFSFSPADLPPKKYTKARVTSTKKTMGGHVNNEVTTGGLDGTDIKFERPVAFGPVQSQAQTPAVPSGLWHNHNQKEPGTCLCCHTYQHSCLFSACWSYLPCSHHAHGQRQHHLKLQGQQTSTAKAEDQGCCVIPGQYSLKALANPLNTAKPFVLHLTWARVFLLTLMYLFFALQCPFHDFVNNSPAFVAITQEAQCHSSQYFTHSNSRWCYHNHSEFCLYSWDPQAEVLPHSIRHLTDSSLSILW